MSIGVTLGGVRKRYADKEALKGISCEFGAGLINAVIGPNGSGKTTLLRLVAGLERLDGGLISYADGAGPVAPGLGLMRRMTLVPQWPVLFNTTLYNNMAYGLRLRGLPARDVSARVRGALEAGGLEPLARARARTLSAGESQRAAFARAFALRPELILLDEPTANLDPEGVQLMEGLITRMKEAYGTTFVLVTHNIFQARRIADRVFFVYKGEIIESGEPVRLFGNPKRDLTRRFLSGEEVY